MSIYKKIVFLGMVVCALLSVGFVKLANAQTEPTSDQDSEIAQFQKDLYALPNVFISNLSLDKKDYSEGDTLNGSFTIKNQGGNVANDIYYNVSVVGLDDSDHVATVTYAEKNMVH